MPVSSRGPGPSPSHHRYGGRKKPELEVPGQLMLFATSKSLLEELPYLHHSFSPQPYLIRVLISGVSIGLLAFVRIRCSCVSLSHILFPGVLGLYSPHVVLSPRSSHPIFHLLAPGPCRLAVCTLARFILSSCLIEHLFPTQESLDVVAAAAAADGTTSGCDLGCW